MSPEAWRKAALTHYLWVLERAGPEYVMDAADRAERASEGVLSGLGSRIRKEVEKLAHQRSLA